MHPLSPRPANRSTLGEALIVISIIAGFFYGFVNAAVGFADLLMLIEFLAIIVVFYMCLLFCRMLFFWMTGGDQAPYPWWEHQGESLQSKNQQLQEARKKK